MVNPILGRDIAVDLGTSTTQVYLRGKGVVLNEPTQLPGPAPVRDGVIADFDQYVAMLTSIIERSQPRRLISGPRLHVTVPALTTEVERRAVKEAAFQAGARQVTLLDAPVMAAIGAGLPLHRRTGTMMVSLGAGLTELSILSLGAVVASSSARVNGVDLDRAICASVRAAHGVAIEEHTAEDLKLEIGAAWPVFDAEKISLAAANDGSGSQTVTVTGADVRHALAEPLADIVAAAHSMLDDHRSFADDIKDHGIVLTGGGALLPGLDMLMSHELGVPVLVAPDPITTVIGGAGRCVEDSALLRGVLGADRRIA